VRFDNNFTLVFLSWMVWPSLAALRKRLQRSEHADRELLCDWRRPLARSKRNVDLKARLPWSGE